MAALVDSHRPWIKRVVERFAGDADIAQDALQDAYLEVRKSIHNLKEPSKFGAWYCGIVLNLCRRRLTSRKAQPESLEALHGGLRFEAIDFTLTGRDPAEVVEEREAFTRVIEAVADLPEAYRSATALFYLRQLSLNEVASALGISVGAVKVRLHRARQQLKRDVMILPTTSVGADLRVRTSNAVSGSKPDRPNRRKPMTRVNIVDVVNRTVTNEEDSSSRDMSVVVLADESNQKALPIWIGRSEGTAIALGVRRRTTPRPLTFATFSEVLRNAGAEVTSVEITRLEDSTYHASVRLNTISGEKTVDARPSDALALSVQFGAPVFVADAVMGEAGVDIDSTSMTDAEGRSIDSIVAEVVDPKRWGAPATGMTAEDRDRACRELIEEVFGSTV